jgi:hypothetical protein
MIDTLLENLFAKLNLVHPDSNGHTILSGFGGTFDKRKRGHDLYARLREYSSPRSDSSFPKHN